MLRSAAVVMTAALLALAPATAVGAAPAGSPTAEAQMPGCDVRSATMTWGFKESFRAYIDGSIANGEWTVADGATYETPEFGFASTSGRVDPRAPLGTVEFAGSVRFTGHGGVLDTTISNPMLVLGGDTGPKLALDVNGPTMDGDIVAIEDAVFVDIDLSEQDLTPVDGVISIENAPTTLGDEGAEAFPNYEAGTEFDPISFSIDVGPECKLTGQPTGTDTIDPGDIGSSPGSGWLVPAVVGGGVLAGAAIIVAVVLLTRRRP